MEQEQLNHLKAALEALLFVSEKPITMDQFKDAISGVSAVEIKQALHDLCLEYQQGIKGIMIVEIAGGWQMLSHSSFAGYIRDFYKTRHKEKLSRPALEALAIIAYKQPVSRTDVEVLRGVNSDGVVMHLLNKGLIKIVGRKEVPGRPYVYGTTQQFLEYFGLKALQDLPKLEDFPSLMVQKNEVLPTSVDEDQQAMTQEPVIDQQRLTEELAKARTKLDIEEIEEQMTKQSLREDQNVQGEMSGQARLMSAQDELMKGDQNEVDEPKTEN